MSDQIIYPSPNFKGATVEVWEWINNFHTSMVVLLSGVPDYFDRNKISSGGDLSHYSSASLY